MWKPGQGLKTAVWTGVIALTLCTSCKGCVALEGIEEDLRSELTAADGGVRSLSAREYVQLRREVAAHREVTLLGWASMGLALVFVAAGLWILLKPPASTADAQQKVSLPDAQPALGPRAVGLSLVVIAALVVLLTPRNKVPDLVERKDSSGGAHETRDAGAPSGQAAGADAGVRTQ